MIQSREYQTEYGKQYTAYMVYGIMKGLGIFLIAALEKLDYGHVLHPPDKEKILRGEGDDTY